jgi:hypothetical protein
VKWLLLLSFLSYPILYFLICHYLFYCILNFPIYFPLSLSLLFILFPKNRCSSVSTTLSWIKRNHMSASNRSIDLSLFRRGLTGSGPIRSPAEWLLRVNFLGGERVGSCQSIRLTTLIHSVPRLRLHRAMIALRHESFSGCA